LKSPTADLLAKAKESLEAARVLAEKGHPGFAASRAYYAMLYAAQALLVSEGHAFTKHASVIAAIGSRFVKTGRLDRRHHRAMIAAFDDRVAGDYGLAGQVTVADANEHLDGARAFISAVETLLI